MIDISAIILIVIATLFGGLLLAGILKDAVFGVFLLILLLPFTQFRIIDADIGSLMISQAAVLLVVVSMLMRESVKREGLGIPKTSLNGALIAFLAASFFSLIQYIFLDLGGVSTDMPLTKPGRVDPVVRGTTAILYILLGVAAYYLIVMLLKDGGLVRKGLRYWIFSGAVAAILGIYAFVVEIFGFLPPLPGSLVGGVNGIVPRELDMISPSFSPLVPRVASVMQEPRHLAIFLAPIIFFSLILAKNRLFIMKPAVQIGLLAATVFAFILTFSRITFILAFAIFVAYLFSLSGPVKNGVRIAGGRSLTFSAAILVASIAVANYLSNYLLKINVVQFFAYQWASVVGGERLNYFSQQMAAFETAWRAFMDHPILGGGLGSFYYFVKIYGLNTQTAVVNNAYLEIMAETGILGITAFIAILVAFYRGLGGEESARGQSDQVITAFKGAFIITCIGYVFFSAFFYPFVWAMMGLAVAYKLRGIEPEMKVGPDANRL